MIGKLQKVYSSDQLVSGLASSDYATDGALSATSGSTNPFATPGVLRGTAITLDTTTNLADKIIASSEDGTGGLKARLAVGNAGKYYTIDTSGTIANVATGTDTTNYVYGRTDIAIQSGASGNYYAFVSHGTDIALWNGGSTISESWWSTIAYFTGTSHPSALTANPHPLLNFNTNLWIADGSQLHNIIPNAAFTTSTVCVNQNVLSLDLFSTIYALGIDPTTGLMLISFQNTVNVGDTISTQAFIGLYDGYSTGLRRKIPVDDLVTSFQNVGGVVYCMFGPKVGYWNGNGITFLRKLANATNSTTGLVYKHRMSNVGNVLLVADGPTLLGYGEPIAGRPKTWFVLGSSFGGTDKIDALCSLGSNKIGLFNFFTISSANHLRILDLFSTAGSLNAGMSYTYFPRPIMVHKLRVFTTGITVSGSIDISINILDEKGVPLPISTASRNVTVAGATTYAVDFDFGGAKCQAVQPFISASNGATWGLVQAIIYYDTYE